MALSKMDKKCKNCKHKDNCDNKRMVACSVAEIPQANMISATFTDNMVPCGQPLMRKETPRKPLILQLKYKLTTEELNKLQDTLDKESNRKIIIVPSYLDVIDY
ncbi:TPA: hypothetical protein ACY4SU_001840 [Clostridium perfringens]